MKNKKGFTLVELMVVIAIVGIVMTLVVASVNSGPDAFTLNTKYESARTIRRIELQLERQNEIAEEANRIRREEMDHSRVGHAEKP